MTPPKGPAPPGTMIIVGGGIINHHGGIRNQGSSRGGPGSQPQPLRWQTVRRPKQQPFGSCGGGQPPMLYSNSRSKEARGLVSLWRMGGARQPISRVLYPDAGAPSLSSAAPNRDGGHLSSPPNDRSCHRVPVGHGPMFPSGSSSQPGDGPGAHSPSI